MKVNASVIASIAAAIPAGLCAASTIVTGLRRTTSSRPGDVTDANASRTQVSSNGMGAAPATLSSPAPANASTAASAHAAFPAWCAPNSGRKIS